MAKEAVLGFLEKNDEISDSGLFAAECGINHDEVVNIIKSLNGFRLIDAQDIKREKWVLTDEGKTYAAAGSPEVQLFLAIPPEGISREDLQVQHVDDKVKDLLIRIQDGELQSPFSSVLWGSRYGRVLFLWFSHCRVLLVSSPSAVEECFTKNDIVFANCPRLLVGEHLGYNYTSHAWAPYGDHWRNLRRISSLDILSSYSLEMLSHICADEIRSLIRRLSIVLVTMELKSTFFELVFNVMMRMISRKRYYGEDAAEAKRFQEMVSEKSQI